MVKGKYGLVTANLEIHDDKIVVSEKGTLFSSRKEIPFNDIVEVVARDMVGPKSNDIPSLRDNKSGKRIGNQVYFRTR